MITLFTTLKPFRDPHIAMIQENAIKSWIAIEPHCEVILLGRDEGVKEIAKRLHIAHIPDIETVNGKLPLIPSLFSAAKRIARFPILCYLNGDIILLDNFLTAVKRVAAYHQSFLGVGRRWDVDISTPLSFKGKWQQELKRLVAQQGSLHGVSGIDYFVFPKKTFPSIPPIVVGRGGWDNWMIFNARSRRIPVVDMTQGTTVIHQGHDEPGTREGATRFTDELAMRNIELAGGLTNLLTIRDADWLLTRATLRRKPFAFLSTLYPWRLLLSWKRNLQHILKRNF